MFMFTIHQKLNDTPFRAKRRILNLISAMYGRFLPEAGGLHFILNDESPFCGLWTGITKNISRSKASTKIKDIFSNFIVYKR